MPKPAKDGDGKLKGLTIPMVGSQLPGSKERTRQKRLLPQDGETMKKMKKVLSLLLVLSVILSMSFTSAFAAEDIEGAATDTAGAGTEIKSEQEQESAPATEAEVETGNAQANLSLSQSTLGEKASKLPCTHWDVLGAHSTWETKSTTPATCTEYAIKHQECSRCYATRDEKDVLGGKADHTWSTGDDIKVTTKPSCIAIGTGHHYCKVCGASKLDVVEIPKLGHDFVITKDAVDIGSIGNFDTDVSHTIKCTNCKLVITEFHGYLPATCTQPEKCACGHVKLNSKPLGHDFSENWTSDDDYHWHVCLRCSEKKDVAEHSYTNPEIVNVGGKYVIKSTCVCGAFETKDISVTLSGLSQVGVNQTIKLTPSIKAGDVDITNKFGLTVGWSSADPSKATVDKDGNVTGVAATDTNEVTIIATVMKNGADVATAIHSMTVTAVTPKYIVKWVDENGTTLFQAKNEYEANEIPEGNAYESLSHNANPTKDGDDYYTYTFKTWVREASANVVTYTASYTATPKTVTVTWLDEDGTKQLDQKTFNKTESEPAQTIQNPTKPEDENNTYDFKEWVRSVDEAGNVTYTATYTATPKTTGGDNTGDNNGGDNPGGTGGTGGSGTYTPPTTTPDDPTVEIDDPNTPLAPDPGLPEEPDEPVIDIDEPDTPLAGGPDEDNADAEIDEEDVPLAGAPKTGDDFQLWTWMTLVMASGAGLACLVLTDRKRRNEAK